MTQPLADLVPTLEDMRDDGEYADAYSLIAGVLFDIEAATGDYSSEVRWFMGAEAVNRSQGSFSDFIRAYTIEQGRLRTGQTLTATDVQNASNNIAYNVLSEIITSGGAVPTLSQIGNDDLDGALPYVGGAAGWSGCLLFTVLGTNEFLDAYILEDTTDTYDLLALVQSAAIAAEETSFGFPDAVALYNQALATTAGTSLSTAATIVSAIAGVESFLFSAYGTVIPIDYARVGLLNASDIMESAAYREFINLGGGSDAYQGNVDGDFIDGSAGLDVVDYSLTSAPIEVYLGPPSVFTSDVPYTGSVSTSGALFSDYLYNIEEIIGTASGDTFEVAEIPAELFMLRAGDGTDVLTVSDDTHGSRTVTLDSVSVSVGKGVRAVELRSIESIILTGDLPDTLLLPSTANWDYVGTPALTVDMGADGLVFDVNGGWMRDVVDASFLDGAVVANLSNSTAQTVAKGSTVLVNVKNANGFIGTDYDDVASAPSDGAYLFGGDGDDQLTGGTDVDTLDGGLGIDVLTGGAGDDVLIIGEGLSSGPSDIEIATGGDGNDQFKIKSGLEIAIDGGAGNDAYVFIDAGASQGVLTFHVGDGHDRVQGWGALLEVHFAGLDASDLKLVWNVTPSSTASGMQYLTGDLAVIIKSTNDSVLFEDISGEYQAEGGENRLYVDLDIWGKVFFDDGELTFWDMSTNLDFAFGSTTQYDVAPVIQI